VSFLAELKRRNVLRMAALYLVAAWLVVQVSSTMLPAFDAPAWALRAVILLLALGLVPALVFAWVFELTPDGLKREDEVSPGASVTPGTAQRMNRTLVVLLLVAVAYVAFDKFVLAPQRAAELVTQTTAQVSAEANKSKAGANSIAVLPFANMSGDAANESGDRTPTIHDGTGVTAGTPVR
jgi:adenylate cyclase